MEKAKSDAKSSNERRASLSKGDLKIVTLVIVIGVVLVEVYL